MLFDLAARLKIWDVEKLGREMSGQLFAEWIAYIGVKSEYEKAALDRKD